MLERLIGERTMNEWLEMTFTAVLVYLVLSRAHAFGTVIRALSGAYAESIGALQGRKV